MKIIVSKEEAAPLTATKLYPTRLLVKELIMRVTVGQIAVSADPGVTILTGAVIEKDGSRTFSAADLNVDELDLNQIYVVGTSPAATIHWWALD